MSESYTFVSGSLIPIWSHGRLICSSAWITFYRQPILFRPEGTPPPNPPQNPRGLFFLTLADRYEAPLHRAHVVDGFISSPIQYDWSARGNTLVAKMIYYGKSYHFTKGDFTPALGSNLTYRV